MKLTTQLVRKKLNRFHSYRAGCFAMFRYKNKQHGWSSRNQRFHIKWRWRHLIPAESDSLPHAHAHATKIYYKHQDSRIKKAQIKYKGLPQL
ncbi:hypothetical protein Tco_0084916 [Tanacetum coccineum]